MTKRNNIEKELEEEKRRAEEAKGEATRLEKERGLDARSSKGLMHNTCTRSLQRGARMHEIQGKIAAR